MKLLDTGTSIQAGEISMTTGIEAASSDRASRQESAQFVPLNLNAANIANYFTGGNAQFCTINSSSGFAASFVGGGGFDLGAITLKNAASTLTLPWASPPPADSPLNDLPPAVIAAGPWTASTSGGAILPASSFGFVLPPPIQIAGGAPLTLDRSQNQTVTWSGSGYDSNATLQLSLTAQYPGSPVLTCLVPAQIGSLTLPSNLLSQFNAGAAGAVSVSVTEGGSGIPYANFSTSNGPLLMLVIWGSTDGRPVDFQ
jgi:hypothetical protein